MRWSRPYGFSLELGGSLMKSRSDSASFGAMVQAGLSWRWPSGAEISQGGLQSHRPTGDRSNSRLACVFEMVLGRSSLEVGVDPRLRADQADQSRPDDRGETTTRTTSCARGAAHILRAKHCYDRLSLDSRGAQSSLESEPEHRDERSGVRKRNGI